MKFHLTYTKTNIALPLTIAWQFNKRNDWSAVIHILLWALVLYRIPEPIKQTYQVEGKPIRPEPEPISPTKAYADQRQKAKRNRRRKPSKQMANLYQLK